MLGRWLSQNPMKRKKNLEQNDYIYLRFDGMQETVNKAARNHKSTMAVFQLDFILAGNLIKKLSFRFTPQVRALLLKDNSYLHGKNKFFY